MTIPSIPTLRWVVRNSGYSEADLGDGESLRIIPVKQFEQELWHYKIDHQPTYLGSYAYQDEAKAAARTWVGDDE